MNMEKIVVSFGRMGEGEGSRFVEGRGVEMNSGEVKVYVLGNPIATEGVHMSISLFEYKAFPA